MRSGIIAGKLCAIFDGAAQMRIGARRTELYVDAARSLIEELDRYRSAPQ